MTVEEFVDNFNKKKDNKKASINNKSFDKLIRHTVSKSLDDLKKEGEEAYEIKLVSDQSILEAYKAKKLKSKKLIKQAKYLASKEKKDAETEAPQQQ